MVWELGSGLKEKAWYRELMVRVASGEPLEPGSLSKALLMGWGAGMNERR